MNLHLPCADAPLRRQQLARLQPAAWKSLLGLRPDLVGEPLLADWAERGWPLVARRREPHDGDGVLLGLPLPPAAGKKRIAVEVRAADVASVSALPGVSEVADAAPLAWRSCLQALTELSREYHVSTGVFGSLAWQWLTGLIYLSPRSDLDVAWTLPPHDRLQGFLQDLADIDARAPMRIDGELQNVDGAGANWRELHAGGSEIAIKTADRVLLAGRADFLGTAR